MATFHLACLFLVIGTSTALYESESHSNNWSYLLFVQEWPPTRCAISISEVTGKNGHCVIPSDVHGWTIHGLWPQETCTEYPSYCNSSWPFDEKKIMDLEPEMKTAWPNMFPDQNRTSFWSHEWDKHGTCSVTLPALDSEHKYFATSLDFHQTYDFTSVLTKAGITPSATKSYSANDIQKAIQSAFEVIPYLECQRKDGEQLLLQMFICIDKSFRKMDCTCQQHACDHDKPVYLLPFDP